MVCFYSCIVPTLIRYYDYNILYIYSLIINNSEVQNVVNLIRSKQKPSFSKNCMHDIIYSCALCCRPRSACLCIYMVVQRVGDQN